LTHKDWHEAYYEAAAIGRYDNVPEARKLMQWIKYKAKEFGWIADGFLV
jgi:hypothetical protein